MAFLFPIERARNFFPDLEFVAPLTPSQQKAAFLVRDSEGLELCLKIISPDYQAERLQRELIALQKLDHPNIVRFREYALTIKSGVTLNYMIEEYIKGNDLTDLLGQEHIWDANRATKFFAELFRGLAALYHEGIVHRDLKPSNIRVRENTSPVIIDFGLARHLNLTDLTRTEEGAGFGTPKYFAPEQFVGTKYDIDHRTDLYATGLLLYEALTGVHPYWKADMSMSDLREAALRSDEFLKNPAFLTLPNNITLLVSRLLAKERVNRPSNANLAARIILKGR
ncbi:MAG: serine/threonine protein kinase [Anaerolineales bacterium]|nr:MAG: serine/threonine protein kinase [Anaerolineales bacterium]